MSGQSEKSRRGRNNRRRGAEKERQTVKWFRERGYVAIHNTHGPFDVMAARASGNVYVLSADPFVIGPALLVAEVKSGERPYGNYSPRERAETLAAALQAGAQAYLAWWPPRASEPTLIPSEDWPT